MAFELLMVGGGRGHPGICTDPAPTSGPSSFPWKQLKCGELGIQQVIPSFALEVKVCCPFVLGAQLGGINAFPTLGRYHHHSLRVAESVL